MKFQIVLDLSRAYTQVITDDSRTDGAEVLYKYEYAIKGFAFKAPNQQILDQVLGFLQDEPNVSVEQDQIQYHLQRNCQPASKE